MYIEFKSRGRPIKSTESAAGGRKVSRAIIRLLLFLRCVIFIYIHTIEIYIVTGRRDAARCECDSILKGGKSGLLHFLYLFSALFSVYTYIRGGLTTGRRGALYMVRRRNKRTGATNFTPCRNFNPFFSSSYYTGRSPGIWASEKECHWGPVSARGAIIQDFTLARNQDFRIIAY